MAHTFTLWFDRLLFNTRPAALEQPAPTRPMQIEVERLPDYAWRDLGFEQRRRRKDDEGPR